MKLIPINKLKMPTVLAWNTSTEIFDTSKSYGVGLVCGKISDSIEVIDIDLKYDLSGTLLQRYVEEINSIDDTIIPLLVVQKTMNQGYHFIYKCDYIEGNKKLANRYAVGDELLEKEKVKVLFETRGEGGYIAIEPTPGYKIIRGSLNEINKITKEQRDILFQSAKTFNEVVNEYKPTQQIHVKTTSGTTSFDDYDERGDVIALLVQHGWSIIKTKGDKVLLKRPGSSTSAYSGNYDISKKWFSVFSTSTEFREQAGYKPYAVFAVLECNGDFSEASKKLYAMGYGDRFENIRKNDDELKSRVSLNDDNFSFLEKEEELDRYINSYLDGTIKKGLQTGFETLDKHWLFKEGNLVVVNGADNVGKSTVIWYLCFMSSLLHGWKWVIFSSENSTGNIFRKLIEFYWSKNIFELSQDEMTIAKKFIKEHFSIIKSQDSLYNYKDIMNMTKKLCSVQEYKGLLIDPYNSLDKPTSSNSHEFDYKALSELKLYGNNHKISIIINTHAVTGSLRNIDADGHIKAPNKADVEGGNKFANKADDFITLHRKTQHPDDWMYTEFHIRKIKDTDTGGFPTSSDAPVRLRAKKGVCGFFEEVNGMEYDPVIAYHVQNGNIKTSDSKQYKKITSENDVIKDLPLTFVASVDEAFDINEVPF